jgi:hypothetical protein
MELRAKMKLSTIADSLWGDKARLSTLLIAASLLLFSFLGGREIWTQEHRWADIVSGMFFRQDFLHPYLGNSNYYDKPLLSYWLIVLFAKLNQALTTWTLRLPSALAGLLAIWSIYNLGAKLKNKQLGLLSGWLLLTTFYFVFWARTSSADMLNLGGSLFAISWYFDKRDQPSFMNYAIFFIIVALTSLCKGLIGAIVPFMAVFVDMVLQKSWKQLWRPSLYLALIPALLLYFLPFVASTYFSSEAYTQNGLYLVYRENFLRYFQAFDHQGPIYTYFIYLPIYLLPSALFFIPALFSLKNRYKTLSLNTKWIIWTLAALFLFFTLSGSRRNYYVLPMVPFAVLFTADWILSSASTLSASTFSASALSATTRAKRHTWTAGLIICSFIGLYAVIDLLQQWYYAEFGVARFASALQEQVNKTKPWSAWKVVMLDAESKLNFYLHLPPTTSNYSLKGSLRSQGLPSEAELLSAWPVLKSLETNAEHGSNTIYVSRKLYAPVLESILIHHHRFEIDYPNIPFAKKNDVNIPIAYIPNQ